MRRTRRINNRRRNVRKFQMGGHTHPLTEHGHLFPHTHDGGSTPDAYWDPYGTSWQHDAPSGGGHNHPSPLPRSINRGVNRTSRTGPGPSTVDHIWCREEGLTPDQCIEEIIWYENLLAKRGGPVRGRKSIRRRGGSVNYSGRKNGPRNYEQGKK